jgi:rhodanese-related sulfurtransferase
MRRVSAREAHELMEQGHAYLDVRTVEEFEQGHPKGAYNVPFEVMVHDGNVEPNTGFLREVRASFAAGAPLVLGCKQGIRSLRAARLLEAGGFTNLVEMRPGMDGVRDPFGRLREPGWLAEKLPLALTAEPGRSYGELEQHARKGVP